MNCVYICNSAFIERLCSKQIPEKGSVPIRPNSFRKWRVDKHNLENKWPSPECPKKTSRNGGSTLDEMETLARHMRELIIAQPPHDLLGWATIFDGPPRVRQTVIRQMLDGMRRAGRTEVSRQPPPLCHGHRSGYSGIGDNRPGGDFTVEGVIMKASRWPHRSSRASEHQRRFERMTMTSPSWRRHLSWNYAA